jgi:hypothetical protein
MGESMNEDGEVMKNGRSPRKPTAWRRWLVATTLAVGTLCPPQALAQVPARFYWKGLSDANAVPLIFDSISGNTNSFDPSHTVTPGAEIDADLALAGNARTFALFERAAMAAILLPMGRVPTVNDNADDDLRMDAFMITLVYGWHPLIEGSRRLKGEN